MSDLIDKLNVLLRSSLNNFLSGEKSASGTGKIAPEKLGKDVDREIIALRKQLDSAMAEQDAMNARLEEMRRQIAAFDQQADDALEREDDAQARHLVQQMQRQEKRARMLEAEIEQHKQATFDLLQNVNTLEALVSDARREQGKVTESAVEPAAPSERGAGGILADVIRGVRERVEETVKPRPEGKPAPSEPAPEQRAPISGEAAPSKDDVDDDLAKRRARLSGPG